MLSGIDIGIIVVYLILTTGIGLYMARRASGSINDYFLGGRTIPWYILGITGMATYIDVSGTMVQTSFFYMFGVKGYWVAFRGAVALFLAFLMIFMGKWLNRSNVMTNAEWMEFRFGNDRQGQTARLLSAFSILVLIIAFAAYFFIGTGKFFSAYLPFSAEVNGLIFYGIVTIYTMAAGFYGVVYTDVFQAMLIFAMIVFFTVKAMVIGTPAYYQAFTSAEWHTLLPSWKMSMPAGYENMKLFGLLILSWIVTNVFQGFALPFDAWTSQRYYAAKNERESSLVAAQWIVLFSLRFLLMMGIAVLAVGIAGMIGDPEMAFNAVIEHYVPPIAKGLILAALLAAAMSTLSSFVNASAAYYVKDIYQRHIKPNASNRHLIRVSYVSTISIIVLGVLIGWNMPTINYIWAWIIMGLFTGMMPPNIIKWFWWRFNGMGYAFGMGSGMLVAILQQLFFQDWPEYTTFAFVVLISTIGTIIGVYAGKPTDKSVLLNFFKKTRPFGFWGPIRQECDPEFLKEVDRENRRDQLLLLPACLWQVTLFWLMTALVVKNWASVGASLLLIAVLSAVLYQYWYKNLHKVSSVV
jgi:Na+/proline symporter